jgi:hypothetical protein
MAKSFSFIKLNIIFMLIVGVISTAIFISLPEAQPAEYTENLDDVTKQSISLVSEMTKYLSTIAFIIVGVLGNIMIGKVKLEHKENTFTTVLFFTSMAFALSSVFYSYVTYSKLFETVSYHKLDVHDAQIKFAQKMQFITLILSAFVFAWYIFNTYLSQLKSRLEV